MRGCTGKVAQRVNPQIRHMHREHSAYSNPTCALRAPVVWHPFDSLFYPCRARKVRTHTSNERSGDNPTLRAHLDQVLHRVVLPGLTRVNSEGARLNRCTAVEPRLNHRQRWRRRLRQLRALF